MIGVCVQVYAFFKTHQRVHSRFFLLCPLGGEKNVQPKRRIVSFGALLKTITWDGSLSYSSEELFQRGRGRSQYIYYF